MIPYTRLHLAPGARFQYSNPGIIVVGKADGLDFDTSVTAANGGLNAPVPDGEQGPERMGWKL